MPRADRLGAACGVIGVAGNLLAVDLLVDVPGAYRLGGLGDWAAAAPAHAAASVGSAVAFVVGLAALAGWARALGRRAGAPAARLGAASMAAGSLLNAAGCVAPAVLVLHVAPACGGDGAACLPVARALLGLTLTLDALFNLLFGLGLVAVAAALARRERRPWLGLLGVAAGLATIPVSLQFALDGAARLLALAGPLWLAFVLWTSALLWRGPARGAARGQAKGEAPGPAQAGAA